MLLRIIDCSAADARDHMIEVVLEHAGGIERCSVSGYASPVTRNFARSLHWYATQYPHEQQHAPQADAVAEKLIRNGQSLGEGLLDEDHRLCKYVRIIEEQGYARLHVQIESSRPAFLAEPWETLILPDSKYVLAGVVAEFSRRWKVYPAPHLPLLDYGLKVSASVPEAIAGMQVQTEGQLAAEPEAPLRILHVIGSVDSGFSHSSASSTALQAAVEALACEGAIEYEICCPRDFAELRERLLDVQRPLHCVHYDGPFELHGGVVQLPLRDAEGHASVEQLASLMARQKIALLCVDARGYFAEGAAVSAGLGLAAVAHASQRGGLGNVIGLSQCVDPWISERCFRAVYHRLSSGLELAQAVVEARKYLQSQVTLDCFTSQPLPFHSWFLLVHYSHQRVRYFASGAAPVTLASSARLQRHRRALLGFHGDQLPPHTPLVDTSAAWSVVTQRGRGVHALLGSAGSGKTLLAHWIALYLQMSRQVQFCFYFDFATAFYSPDTMRQMIAPVLSLEPTQLEAVSSALAQLECCFVLDAVLTRSAASAAEDWPALRAFLASLLEHGHWVLLTGSGDDDALGLDARLIHLQPLSNVEQRVLAASRLRRLALIDREQQPQWQELLVQLRGSPFLIVKCLGLLRTAGLPELIESARAHLTTTADAALVSAFHEWQWAGLSQTAQRLLLLCAGIEDLLLEMIGIACDQKQPGAAAQHLFQGTGETFGAMLAQWRSMGFTSEHPQGTQIDRACRDFLAGQRAHSPPDPETLLCFSQVVCDGLRLLCRHLTSQQNPTLAQHVLLGCSRWVEHLERLWFAAEYSAFMTAKAALDQLLQQAGLQQRSAEWSLDLLGRSPTVNPADVSAEAKLCWLSLAGQALTLPAARVAPSIEQGARRWHAWLEAADEELIQEDGPAFQCAGTFLLDFHFKVQDWPACIEVGHRVASVYLQRRAWSQAIDALRAVASAHAALGQREHCLTVEEQILNEIPYRECPRAMQLQQALGIAFARAARGAYDAAQVLLDRLRQQEEATRLGEPLDRLQAEILHGTGRFVQALPYYCSVWPRALESGNRQAIAQLRSRFEQIEQALGEGQFEAWFDAQSLPNVLRPRQLAASQTMES